MTTPLFIHIPSARVPEHTWVIRTLLVTYLGLDISIVHHDQPRILITDEEDQRTLELPSVLLTSGESEWNPVTAIPVSVPHWVNPNTLPWVLPEPDTSIPILYVDKDPEHIESSDRHIRLNWDLFGSAFFMLSRLEEVLLDDADNHGRFPASSSLAVKNGFERIPVVNAWAEILWGAIHQLWPELERRQHQYRVVISHDVDWPLVSNRLSLKQIVKSSVGDVVVRRSVSTAARRFLGSYLPESIKPRVNPGNTFDFIMRFSEQYGLASAFYFIPENTAGLIDGTYTFEMPFIQQLLKDIHERGHEIGIHPGYNTYRSEERIVSGFNRLRRMTDSLGIEQSEWGGRQHYLRWSARETWRHWSAAGLTYDSTVGFAETVGFRAGACFDYPAFDVLERSEIDLIERPLIVMEGSLFRTTSSINLTLDDEKGLDVVLKLASSVRAYTGNFTLLWHNSSLITSRQKRLYENVVEAATLFTPTR